MLLDLNSGDRWNEPICKSCKRSIGPAEPTETLRIEGYEEQQLEDLNGLYHRECARPFMSVLRALESLRRLSF